MERRSAKKFENVLNQIQSSFVPYLTIPAIFNNSNEYSSNTASRGSPVVDSHPLCSQMPVYITHYNVIHLRLVAYIDSVSLAE